MEAEGTSTVLIAGGCKKTVTHSNFYLNDHAIHENSDGEEEDPHSATTPAAAALATAT